MTEQEIRAYVRQKELKTRVEISKYMEYVEDLLQG
jgi:hypothetical protein